MVIYLAFRDRTGCRQYSFDDYFQMIDYFAKACYHGETIHVMVFISENGAPIYQFNFLADCLEAL